MPRLSIIVPVYKVELYIHKCVESILNQTYTDFELILVDDGSPDSCGKICDEYAKKDSRIRVIHKENGGQSSARNRGLDIATGDLIGFVDSDDDIESDMYQQMVDFLDAENLDIVCCDTYLVRGERKKVRLLYPENKVFIDSDGVCENLKGHIDNAVWNKVYKREIFRDLRFTEGIVFEDVRLIYQLFNKASRVGYISKPLYYYYKRKNSTIAQAFNSKSRYDCFVGYKKRLEFAIDSNLPCVIDCERQCLETALATMTAFFANNEDNNSDRFIAVSNFIESCIKSGKEYHLKSKNKMLLSFFKNCKSLYKLYAICSAATKKAKNI